MCGHRLNECQKKMNVSLFGERINALLFISFHSKIPQLNARIMNEIFLFIWNKYAIVKWKTKHLSNDLSSIWQLVLIWITQLRLFMPMPFAGSFKITIRFRQESEEKKNTEKYRIQFTKCDQKTFQFTNNWIVLPVQINGP